MPGTPIDAWLVEAPSSTADEVAKQAMQDAARHEEQVVKLILFHDDRALRLLAVYVPVLGALVAELSLNFGDGLAGQAAAVMG